MIYLYIKTHNKTGLKYLGKTSRNDPYKYQGSGVYWQRHLQKHGYDVTTKILLATNDKQEIKETGIFFSKIFNVVESIEWANLIFEQGDGGPIRNGMKNSTKQKIAASNAKSGKNHHLYGKHHKKETKEKISLKIKGVPKSKEHKDKIGNSIKGNKRPDLSAYNKLKCSKPALFRGKEYSSIQQIMNEYKISRWFVEKDESFQLVL